VVDNKKIRIIGDGKTEWKTYDGLHWFRIDLNSNKNTASLNQLEKFGLTPNEANAWLEQEPNFYNNRRKVTRPETDEDETEPVAETSRGSIRIGAENDAVQYI